MAWRSILVHIKPYQDNSPSLEVATALARSFEARLTGLYTLRELAMLKLLLGADHQAVQNAAAGDAPLTAQAKAHFLETCAKAGIDAAWDVGEGSAQELLSLAGRCHDLLIVGQSSSGLDGVGTDLVEECAVASGVPTLIVPRKGRCAAAGRRVVVAWNHSRQSAAAVHAAMPLIERADEVVVLLGRERDALSSVTLRPRHDVAAFLARHARRVMTVAFEAGEAEAGIRLLSAARNAGGDLLVMGAYGRSAWREFLLGGATRSVLANLDVPVLMAH